MDSMLLGAAFTILGSLIAVGASYFFARADRDWISIKGYISKLSQQVESYHCLERIYAERLAALDPSAGSVRTTMAAMRDKIVEDDKKVRPEMTATEARRIRERSVYILENK
jgi:hypothetical protein